MKIFLTGASGFIGGHVLNALVERGHQVTCLLRGRSAAHIRAMALPGCSVVEGEFTRPETWLSTIAGHDAVVNAVGIIRETASASFEQVHQLSPIALFTAALTGGMKKIVQVSALGADEQAASQYHRTKRAADQFLVEKCAANTVTTFAVLRPSFVYGPQDESMAFFLSLAAQPVTAVPGDGKYRVQPVHVADVVRAVVAALENPALKNIVQDIGGAHALSFDEMLDVLARRLGKASATKIHVPLAVMKMVAGFTDLCGGHGPITGEELAMLQRGNFCSGEQERLFVERFGFQPLAFEEGIARRPLSQQDVWNARMNPWRLPLRLTIAFIWIATGVVSAFISPAQGLQLLDQIGITGTLASALMYGTSIFEIIIGLLTVFGIRIWLMGAIQLLLMFGFMGILTLRMPELWFHPFGPLTKNIPLIGATLVMMAWE